MAQLRRKKFYNLGRRRGFIAWDAALILQKILQKRAEHCPTFAFCAKCIQLTKTISVGERAIQKCPELLSEFCRARVAGLSGVCIGKKIVAVASNFKYF